MRDGRRHPGRIRLRGRAQHGQGHAERTLGNGRRAGALRMGLFPRAGPCVSGAAAREADRARTIARRARQLSRLGDGDHRATGRGACPDGQADRLHLGRQRVSDRGARGGLRPRAAPRPVPDRARAGRRVPHRPCHRAAVRRDERARFRAHRQPPRLCRAATCADRARQARRGRRRSDRHRQDPATSSRTGASAATIKATGNAALFDATLDGDAAAPDRSIVFSNFVDFDMLYGHRRDVDGLRHGARVFRHAHARAARRSCAPATSRF